MKNNEHKKLAAMNKAFCKALKFVETYGYSGKEGTTIQAAEKTTSFRYEKYYRKK